MLENITEEEKKQQHNLGNRGVKKSSGEKTLS